jgi:hypothetical protein
MIDPYMQLQMMQQAGAGQLAGQYIPGFGQISPQARAGGAAQLGAMATMYGSPITGERGVDPSPMAGLGLSGPFAPLMNIGGNMLLSPMMRSSGMMPMGNAGSYNQARRAREQQEILGQLSQGVGDVDAAGVFRSLRGAAAMAGMPMNAEQTEAARNLSETIASAGPMLGMVAPELMDAISGETGSVQAMAGRVMTANRYQLDPVTGKQGYSADSNEQLVRGLFDKLYSDDNMARMQGLRAGDMGQMYESLSAEGLAGPKGNLRDRTIGAIREIQREGDPRELQAEASRLGVTIDSDNNLQALSNADLAKLREGSSTVRDRITESDTDRISGQLQDYVKSISAIREVFGENGDPNAPMPKLIGALEGLTSGRMHTFDASRLNTMVRDMQSLSQQSGKSVDQLVAMNQSNNKELVQMLGQDGGAFAPTSTNYGVTTGQAFQEVGGATGFGTLSRAEAESGAQSLFNRGMASEMSNTLGALTRLERDGGFEDDPDAPGFAAGQDLRAALQAVDDGADSYIDSTGTRRDVPTQEREWRSFFHDGAVPGMEVSDFNMMLGDTFANQEALAETPDRQRGAVRQQFHEFERKVDRTGTSRVEGMSVLRDKAETAGLSVEQRQAAASDISSAAYDAMFDLSAEDLQDRDVRQQVMVDAIQREAAASNMTYTDEEATRVADTLFANSNNVAREDYGGQSTYGVVQMQGRKVSASQQQHQIRAEAVAGRNEAMSNLGPKGGIIQRMFTSLQKQGDRGPDADLTTLFGDMFGAEDIDAEELTPLMEVVREKEKKSKELEAELDGLDPTELDIGGEDPTRTKMSVIREQIKTTNQELDEAVIAVKEEGRRLGIVEAEGDFNYEDVSRGKEAAEDLDNRRNVRATRKLIRDTATITDADLEEAGDSRLTEKDLRVLAKSQRKKDIELVEGITQEDLNATEAEQEEWSQEKRDAVEGITEEIEELEGDDFDDEFKFSNAKETYEKSLGTEEEYLEERRGYLDNNAKLENVADKDARVAILRDRRSRADMSVSDEDVQERRELFAEDIPGEEEAVTAKDKRQRDMLIDASMSDDDFDEAIDEMRADAEDAGQPEPTEAIRKRKLDRRTVRSKQYERAEKQLLAEKQMRAAGYIGEDDTLRDREALEEVLEDSDMDEDLQRVMVTGSEEQQYEAHVEQLRRNALGDAFDRGDGELAEEEPDERNLRKVKEDLATIDSLADEFLADEEAVSVRGVQGVKDLRSARDRQITLANKFGMSREELVLDPSRIQFNEEQREELTKEFDDMTAEEKGEVLEELQGSEVSKIADTFKGKDVADLTAQDYIDYQRMQEQEKVEEAIDDYDDARESLSGGARGNLKGLIDVDEEDTEAAQELFRRPPPEGPSEEDTKAAQELFNEDVEVTDDQAIALKTLEEAIGRTEGGDEITDEEKKAIVNQMVSGEEVDLDNTMLSHRDRELYENIQEVESEAAEAAEAAEAEDVEVTDAHAKALKTLNKAISLAGDDVKPFTDEQKRIIVERMVAGEELDLGSVPPGTGVTEEETAAAQELFGEGVEGPSAEDTEAAQELFGEGVEVTDAQTIALKTLDEAIERTEGGEDFTDDQKKAIVNQMVSGEEVDPAYLTPEQRELYENIQKVEAEAAEAEDVEVTDEQSRALRTLDEAIDRSEGVEELTKEQKQDIVNQMAAGEEIDTSDLSPEQIEMLEKIKEVEAEELGISTEDTEAAQELFGEEAEVTNEQTLALKTLDRAIDRTEGGEDFTAEDKRAIVERMVSGEEVDLENLTPQQQELYKNIQEVKAEDEELGLTAEQLETLESVEGIESLAGMSSEGLDALEQISRIEGDDIEGKAKDLGVSEDEYLAMLRGEDDEGLEGMQMFETGADGKLTEQGIKDEKAVRTNVLGIDQSTSKIERIDNELKALEERGITDTKEVKRRKADRAKLVEERDDKEQALSEQMEALGYDPENEDERERFHTDLRNQKNVRRLQTAKEQREEYAASLDPDMTTEEREQALEDYTAMQEQAETQSESMQELTLGEAGDALAAGVGYNKEDYVDESGELIEGKSDEYTNLDFGDQPANQRMLAENLEALEGYGDEDATALEKLDSLTDAYYAADGDKDKLKALAEEAGMSERDLDEMMIETEFLGLEEENVSGESSADQAEFVSEGLKSVEDRDMQQEADEVKEHRMELTGTLRVEGDIKGKATFKDVTGDKS